MSDQDQDFRIKVSMDPTSAMAGGDAIIAKQEQIKAELAQATAVAKQYGTSIEAAQNALSQLRTEQAQAEVAALRQAMQSAAKDTSPEEAAEQFKRIMQERQEAMVTNAFYLHRLAEGAKDIALGGRMASQGIMDVEYAVQRLLPPQAQMWLAGMGVVTMLVMMATRHREVAGEAKAHADAEKDAAKQIEDAWKPLNDLLESSLKNLKENQVFKGLADQAKEFTAELDIQQNVLKTIQTALDRLEDAKFGAQEALLNREEQEALKGKTGDDAEAIRLEYEKKLDDLRGTHERDKADRAVKAKEAELLDLQKQVKALNDQKTAALGDVQRSHDSTTSGATRASLGQSDWEAVRDEIQRLREQQRASAAGEVDNDEKAIPHLTDAEAAKLISDSFVEPQLHKEQQDKGPQYTLQIQALKDQLKELQDQTGKDASAAQSTTYETYAGGPSQQELRQQAFDAIQAKFNEQAKAIEDQIAAFSKTQQGYETTDKAMETATKTIADTNKKLEELSGKIEASKSDVAAAKAGVEAATYKGQADSDKDANSQEAFQDKQARETRDLNLKAQIDQVEEAIKDNAGNEARLAELQRQKDKLAAEQIENETRDKQAGQTMEPGLSQATGAEGAARAGSAADSTKTDRAAATASGEAPLQAQLQQARDALATYQQNVQQIADHAREMGALGKKHAENTTQLAASMKAQLDELRATVARDEQALRDFKQQAKTNLQQ